MRHAEAGGGLQAQGGALQGGLGDGAGVSERSLRGGSEEEVEVGSCAVAGAAEGGGGASRVSLLEVHAAEATALASGWGDVLAPPPHFDDGGGGAGGGRSSILMPALSGPSERFSFSM